MSSSTLFLTGGSGYVGRNLIRRLCADGHHVRALVRSPHAEAVVEALGAQPVQGDLLDPGIVAAMQGCTALIHAAADTDQLRQPGEEQPHCRGCSPDAIHDRLHGPLLIKMSIRAGVGNFGPHSANVHLRTMATISTTVTWSLSPSAYGLARSQPGPAWSNWRSVFV
ncbi:TPA: SDR family oxidoreductase [Stenotrophomonas maltophilia]|uniref:SDR family oxidoreductase n=1 Tax=Stenotrophomonas TaxID=40323 RepID=UPI00122FE570|nr:MULTISPECIES: NAD(P)H-binding protein [Stenotrophomonas maltophilia group]MBA0399898.1 NAD-dependent epimerase/dehydratase family protein [Stenotrophomonas maltophilia]MDJ1522241.1 NAD(P)H-binding protein [Stenotrophomonas maltophilia]UUS15977.1 NAD(P)H-binding protein [Stenotrophomonas sp. CD2]HEL3255367.1 NAD(P)H-binding protein [Stenotrophomonas maltophilia]